MSVLGTGVAAGVAQVNLQSKEEAKKRDRVVNEGIAISRHVREAMEAHLQGLEEGDNDSVDRVHIDAQVPEHEQETLDQALQLLKTERPKPPETATPKKKKGTKTDGGLYHHLDVKA